MNKIIEFITNQFNKVSTQLDTLLTSSFNLATSFANVAIRTLYAVLLYQLAFGDLLQNILGML